MKFVKKAIAAALSAMLFVGSISTLPMSRMLNKPVLTASAEYGEKNLLKTDVLKKLIKETNPKHVIFTSDSPRESENLKGKTFTNVTPLAEFVPEGEKAPRTTGAYCAADDTVYVYSSDESGWPAIAPESCCGLFEGMEQLVSVNMNGLSLAQTKDMSRMFYGCSSLENVYILTDTGKCENMSQMFFNCSSLVTIKLGVSNYKEVLDTSNVKYFNEMFSGCYALTKFPIEQIDTGSAVDMNKMFYQCSSATSLDVSSFDTSNVTSMMQMFYHCRYLTQLDLSNFDTKNVTNFSGMFDECFNLKSLDISSFTFKPSINLAEIQKFVYLPQNEKEAASFVPLQLTISLDYYKAFQFDENYVIRNKTAIEDIVASGESMDLDTDGSFKLYVYMNRKDEIFTAPDSQAFLRCTMPNGSVLDFDKKSTAQKNWGGFLNGKWTVCDGFALPIGAKDFDKTITIELYKDANTKINGSYHFSATQYLEAWKDLYSDKADREGVPEVSKAVKNFIDAMENYGVYADVYFNHKYLGVTSSNPKKYSQDTYKYYVEGENGRQGTLQYYYNILCQEIPDAHYYGTTLLLENSITLRHYFTKQVNGSKESELNKGLYYLEKSFPALKLSKGVDGYEKFTVDDYIYFVLKDNERTDDNYIRLKNLCISLAEFQFYASEYERIYNLYKKN